jgi:hypothetical protein
VAEQQQYNVRQIADFVRRPHETTKTVVDRIRSWADYGLLQPVGEKHPGTGKKRRYGPATIIDAAVLTALTDAGLAAVRVGHFQGADGQTVIGFGRMGAAEVYKPENANKKIYLVIAGSPAASVHLNTYIAIAGPEAQPDLDLSKPTPFPARTTEHVTVPPYASWSVVLNLNEIFRSFKDVLTATLEGGFIKIEMISSAKD